MRIDKHDTNGTKPLLGKGELGYDDYTAGGDTGRVYVGTGSENISLAKKSEVITVDGKVDAHVARVDNPHGVTKTQVGLGNVDNTADTAKVVASAGKWTTARLINGSSVDGTLDVTTSKWGTSRSITIGSTAKSVDGSSNITWTLGEIGAISVDSVTQSNTDTTTGRLLKVGDFGLTNLRPSNDITDLNNITTSGNYYIYGGTANAPINGYGYLISNRLASSGNGVQQFIDLATGRVYIRRYALSTTTWSSWMEVHTDSDVGTFTPRVYGSTTAGVGTYSNQYGYYEKFGKEVRFSLWVNITAHTGTGNIYIDGLPFLPDTPYTSLTIGQVSNLTFSGQLVAWCNNDGIIRLQTAATGATAGNVAMDTTFSIMISGSYRTA